MYLVLGLFAVGTKCRQSRFRCSRMFNTNLHSLVTDWQAGRAEVSKTQRTQELRQELSNKNEKEGFKQGQIHATVAGRGYDCQINVLWHYSENLWKSIKKVHACAVCFTLLLQDRWGINYVISICNSTWDRACGRCSVNTSTNQSRSANVTLNSFIAASRVPTTWVNTRQWSRDWVHTASACGESPSLTGLPWTVIYLSERD